MLLLTNTSSIIRAITSAAGNVTVDAAWTDFTAPSTYNPDGLVSVFTSAEAKPVVPAPAASTDRNVRTITIKNKAATTNIVTVEKYDGTNTAELSQVTLLTKESLVLTTEGEWQHYDANGALYTTGAGSGGVTDHTLLTNIGTLTHDQIETALTGNSSAISSHTSNTSNPHSTTKAQVGLANVDNTSDANKPVSTATQTALDAKATKAANNTFTKAQRGSLPTVAYAATITLDFSDSNSFNIGQLTGNLTLANPTNMPAANETQSGSIFFQQDATGNRILTLGSNFKWAGTAGTLSTGANAKDRLDYVVDAAGLINVSLAKGIA